MVSYRTYVRYLNLCFLRNPSLRIGMTLLLDQLFCYCLINSLIVASSLISINISWFVTPLFFFCFFVILSNAKDLAQYSAEVLGFFTFATIPFPLLDYSFQD